MDSKTTQTISPNGCRFTTTYTTGGILKESKNAVYSGSGSIQKTTSTISLNNKRYEVNNITGEVTPEEFSWRNFLFGTSKKLIKAISETINKVKENFENPEIVEQYQWGISGVTSKGAKQIEQAQRKIESKKHTENMIMIKW